MKKGFDLPMLCDAIALTIEMSFIGSLDKDYAPVLRSIEKKDNCCGNLASGLNLSQLVGWFKQNIINSVARVNWHIRFGYVLTDILNAAISLHSVKHETSRFRVVSSNGLESRNNITNINSFDFRE